MNPSKMGKLIRKKRKELDLSQEKFGEMFNVGGKAVSKWENGISCPDVILLGPISETLGITIAELLSGELNTKNEIDHSETMINAIKMYQEETYKKNKKIITFLVSLFMIIVVLLLSMYFVTNYNKCFVYRLSSDNNNFYLEGIIARNQKNNTILISGIIYDDPNRYTDKELFVEDYSLIVKVNDSIIYRKDNNCNRTSITDVLKSESIVIEENSKLTNYILNKTDNSNINIIIEYQNEDTSDKFIIPIKKEKRFSNNKIIY